MANISLTMKHEARIMRAWKKSPAEMANAIAMTIKQVGVFLTGKVKEHITSGTDMWKAPLDTGAMRRGIHPVFETMKAYIRPSSTTPYAEAVHEGTRFMRARPFFEVTAAHEEKSVTKFLVTNIDKALAKLKV